MRKTILLLINGFGIEKKGSTPIYSDKLMPALDSMTKNYLFGSLAAPAGDFNNAYRMFSMPDKVDDQNDEITNLIYDKKLDQNEVLKSLKENSSSDNNIHLFYIIENSQKFSQVREFVKIINNQKDKKVFVHFIMTGTSTENYDDIIKVISKFSFETSDYCKVGMVVGKNKVNDDDFLRAVYKEQGEHWNESTKKFDILKRDIINPLDAGVFIINGGFSLKENDTIFIVNYKDIDLEKTYNDITKMPLKIYSLYPYKDSIPFMFNRPINNSISLSSLVEQYGINILVLTDPTRLNDINFYLNGMEKKKSNNIAYALNDLGLYSSKEAVIKLVDGNNYNGFIIDFNISNFTKLEEMKQLLSSIDSIIKNISETAKEKDYTFIVSSLYGIHSSIMDGAVQKTVDFFGKVPCIFQSNMFGKAEYSLNSGNTYSLMQTFLTNIDDNVKSNKLVHKLSSIEKMLSKK